MLVKWKELVPGLKTLDLRTRHKTLKKRVLVLSDKLEDDEADRAKGRERNLGDDGSTVGDLRQNASSLSLPDMSSDLKFKPKKTHRGIEHEHPNPFSAK